MAPHASIAAEVSQALLGLRGTQFASALVPSARQVTVWSDALGLQTMELDGVIGCCQPKRGCRQTRVGGVPEKLSGNKDAAAG